MRITGTHRVDVPPRESAAVRTCFPASFAPQHTQATAPKATIKRKATTAATTIPAMTPVESDASSKPRAVKNRRDSGHWARAKTQPPSSAIQSMDITGRDDITGRNRNLCNNYQPNKLELS